jgi:hypothetical protein
MSTGFEHDLVLRRLQIPKGMSYRTVLIHAGELSSALDEGDFFSATINLAQLLI